MKQRLRLFRRGDVFYFEDTNTRKQGTLGTKDKAEAQRLLELKRQTLGDPTFRHLLLKTCLSASDPSLLKRSWGDVMEQMKSTAREGSRARIERAFSSKEFSPLRLRTVVETSASDLLSVLSSQKSSIHHYLRRLYNLAVGLGWLPSCNRIKEAEGFLLHLTRVLGGGCERDFSRFRHRHVVRRLRSFSQRRILSVDLNRSRRSPRSVLLRGLPQGREWFPSFHHFGGRGLLPVVRRRKAEHQAFDRGDSKSGYQSFCRFSPQCG